MRKDETLLNLLMLSVAIDSIGVYPMASVDENGVRMERTLEQNGWNKCYMEIRDRHIKFDDWSKSLSEPTKDAVVDLIKDGSLYLSLRDGEIRPWLFMSDVFGFACADGEDISKEEILQVHDLWKEFGYSGLVAFVAKKRGIEPLEDVKDGAYRDAIEFFEEGLNSSKPRYNKNIRCQFRSGRGCMLLFYSLLGKFVDDEADLPCEDCEMRESKDDG